MKEQEKMGLSQWERVQMVRLLCALGLFLVLCLGRQMAPERMHRAGAQVMAVVGSSQDFEAVFSALGESLAGQEDTWKGIEDFCIQVFGAQELPRETRELPPLPLPESPVGAVSQGAVLLTPFLEERPVKEVVPAVGTVLVSGERPAQGLPRGYTTDKLSFGGLETSTPVLGLLNSPFGYRDHPVNGKHLFHGGVDIDAQEGDDIAAFADGVVEYVGEDDSYGLYFQLDHGGGIKSFYAHCQRICVTQGSTVRAGETVAKVGATGRVTGPHLHLELKCGGVRVDPAYYVELLGQG